MRYRGASALEEEQYFHTAANGGGGGDIKSAASSDYNVFLSICIGILFAAVATLGIVFGILLNSHGNQIDDLSPGPVGATGLTGDTGLTGAAGRVVALTEPCNCTSDVNATGLAICTNGFEWHSLETHTNYACNLNVSQWWSTETHDAWGESAIGTSCQTGEDPSNRDGCTLGWGSGIGSDNQRIGRYFLPNWVITDIAFSDDGDANIGCNATSTYDIQMWDSAATDSANFTLLHTFASGQNLSRVTFQGINVPVEGDAHVTFGIANDCDVSISDFLITIYYRLTPVSYV